MKHITCDKCGLPMEPRCSVRIDHKKYDICCSCENEMMKGLENKGEICEQLLPPKDIYKKFNPDSNKFLCQD